MSMMNIEIVDSLRSLYPLKDFEEEAIMEVLAELRELKEKATAKKPIVEEVTKAIYEIKAYRCPVCRHKLISKIDGSWCGGTQSKHCDQCGTAIDWSEGKR